VRDTEVDDNWFPIKENDIRGFEVPVDDTGGVDRTKRVREPTTQQQQRPALEWSVLGHDLVEDVTGDVPRHDVGPRSFGIGIEHSCHPSVLHPGQGPDLAHQTVARLSVVRNVLAQNLDGHRASRRIERQVDDAHATLAELLDQPIGADPLPRSRHDPARLVVAPQTRSHAPTVCRHGSLGLEAGTARTTAGCSEDYCWM
jgi:hypothetical protein